MRRQVGGNQITTKDSFVLLCNHNATSSNRNCRFKKNVEYCKYSAMNVEKCEHGIGSNFESQTGENLNKELQSTTADEEPTANSQRGSTTESVSNNPSEYKASSEKEVKDKTRNTFYEEGHKEYKKSLHISPCNLIVMQFAISAMVTVCVGFVFQQMFIKKEMDSLKTKLQEMQKEIDTLNDVRQDLRQCRSVNSTNKLKVSQNSEIVTHFDNRIQKELNWCKCCPVTIKSQMKSLKYISNKIIMEFDNISSKFNSVSRNLSMVNATTAGLKNRESIISNDLSCVNASISQLKIVEFPQLEKEIQSAKTTSTQLEIKLDHFTRKLAIINGTVEIQDYKHVPYHEMLLFGLIGGIIEACIILVIVANWNRRDKKKEIKKKTNRLLDQNRTDCKLQRSICCISFNDCSQQFHEELLNSALPTGISITRHLVRQPDVDIPSIPRHKIIFLFIDKNERNVILENPDDTGHTKLKTAEAAEKIGAEVFVVYVKNEESKNLPRDDLYNKKLTAFTRHEGLKRLTDKNRSFSVYENFTDYQKEHIKNDVTKLLS